MDRIARIAVLFAAGCGCPELARAPVSDPDGLAAPGQVEGIRAALQDFAAWTGGPAVCVPGVRLTEDDDLEGALGRWDGAGQPMRVAGAHPQAYGTVVHELCHAWDEGAGFESEWHPQAFREDEISDVEVYDTPRLRVREAFARACEDGPVDLRLRDDLAQRCGFETRERGARWVDAEVYAPVRPAPVVEDLAPRRLPLDATLGGLRVLDVVAGGGRVWVLGMRPRPFHPLQPARIYHVVLGLDPVDGRVLSTAMLRRDPEARRRFRLVGGEPRPLLVEEGPDATWLAELGEDGRPGTPLVLGPGAVRWDGAARVGDEIWMTGVDEVAEDGLAVLALGSGAVAAAPLDPPLPAWRAVFGHVTWTPQGEVLVGGFTERLGAGLLRIDPERGTWAASPLPDGAEAGRVGALPDGRAVVPTAVWSGDHKLRGLAALGPGAALALPEGCEADRVADGLRFLPLPDGLWVYEDATSEDGVAHGRWLTRVGPAAR